MAEELKEFEVTVVDAFDRTFTTTVKAYTARQAKFKAKTQNGRSKNKLNFASRAVACREVVRDEKS
jgi:hypothetical protein